MIVVTDVLIYNVPTDTRGRVLGTFEALSVPSKLMRFLDTYDPKGSVARHTVSDMIALGMLGLRRSKKAKLRCVWPFVPLNRETYDAYLVLRAATFGPLGLVRA